MAANGAIVFEDIFDVQEKNPDGKKFDHGLGPRTHRIHTHHHAHTQHTTRRTLSNHGGAPGNAFGAFGCACAAAQWTDSNARATPTT